VLLTIDAQNTASGVNSKRHVNMHAYSLAAAAAAAANVLLLAGWMEEVVVTKMIDYLKKREADGEPFFLYYPSFSVHA
jgi:hypothetical protein